MPSALSPGPLEFPMYVGINRIIIRIYTNNVRVPHVRGD